MLPDNPKPNDALIVRWLALAGAAGAAIAAAMSHFSDNWVWQALAPAGHFSRTWKCVSCPATGRIF